MIIKNAEVKIPFLVYDKRSTKGNERYELRIEISTHRQIPISADSYAVYTKQEIMTRFSITEEQFKKIPIRN